MVPSDLLPSLLSGRHAQPERGSFVGWEPPLSLHAALFKSGASTLQSVLLAGEAGADSSRRPFTRLQGLTVSRLPRQGPRSRICRFGNPIRPVTGPFGHELPASRFFAAGRIPARNPLPALSRTVPPGFLTAAPLWDSHPSGSTLAGTSPYGEISAR